ILMPRDGKRALMVADYYLLELGVPPVSGVRQIALDDWPWAIAFGPRDTLLYWTGWGRSGEINTRTLNIKRRWTMATTTAMAVSPDGKYMYAGESGAQFDVMRLSDLTVVKRIVIPNAVSCSTCMAVSPDGKELYVAIYAPNALLVYRLADPENPVLDRTIPLT